MSHHSRRPTPAPRRLALIGQTLAHYRITAAIGEGGFDPPGIVTACQALTVLI